MSYQRNWVIRKTDDLFWVRILGLRVEMSK